MPENDEITAKAPFKVSDVHVGGHDGRGKEITDVYFWRSSYAIYLSIDWVMVQYADNETDAKTQIAKIADLMPLRDCLQYLITQKDVITRTDLQPRYLSQTAEAFRLGLEDKADLGKTILNDAIEDVRAILGRNGRVIYLAIAGGFASAAAILMAGVGAYFLVYVFGSDVKRVASGIGHLLLAAASGGVGALLSTAIALRSRTIATQSDWISNGLDGLVRILIGVISAGVFYLILASGLLTKLSIGTQTTDVKPDGLTWQLTLIVGFMAGFAERLVPDLLEKKSETQARTQT